MANMCSNFVTFQGNETKLKKVENLFDNLIARQKENGKGQLPEGIEGSVYLFDIYKNDKASFSIETKWCPPISELVQIADLFNLDFEVSYEEMGCLLYGNFFYEKGRLFEMCLDNDDFELYENPEYDLYIFEGNRYECQNDILEILLSRKLSYY